MDITEKTFLAIDTAYEHGRVALFGEKEIWYDQALPDKMSHGIDLCDAIRFAMRAAQDRRVALTAVFSGLGPGSFVGIRISLATLLGFSFARQLPIMGFCSHLALANSLEYDHERFKIFMKASGDLGYLSSYRRDNGRLVRDGEIVLVDINSLKSPMAEIILTDRHIEVGGIVGRDWAKPILGPTARGIKEAVFLKLESAGTIVDESEGIKPNYIKMPNVSLPKKNLVICSPSSSWF